MSASDKVNLERPIERILDLARWAPSGDNQQPWRFEILDDNNLRIHTFDTRDWCVYDLDGSSSQIAVGALLETLDIAASVEGMYAVFSRSPDTAVTALCFDVNFKSDPAVQKSELHGSVESRVTQRRPFKTDALSQTQKQAMEQAAGEGYQIIWMEGALSRRQMAKLLFNSAHIRLTTPEGFEVHRKTIDWGKHESEDRIPEHAVGADFLTLKIMRWALQSWARVKFLNRFFAGTWLPRLKMDLLPGYMCGAHFLIVSEAPLKTIDDYVAGGRAVQRFWLEATHQKLQFQPEMTPLIFSRYSSQGLEFTVDERARERAGQVARDLTLVLGPHPYADNRVYMGRVGVGNTPSSRSIRKRLKDLMGSAAD